MLLSILISSFIWNVTVEICWINIYKTLTNYRLNGFLFAGENFKTYADRVMRHALHKGVPPLFVNLRSLYKDPEKVRMENT